MPALVAFGRRWQIGSDDFVVPGFLDLLIRISWLIAAVVIYWKNDKNLNMDSEGGFHMKIYLYGVFAILHLIIVFDIALVHNSKAGFMMDKKSRRYVPLCLYLRLFSEVVEIGWSVLGSLWAANGQLTSSNAPEAGTLIIGLVISNWVLITIWIVGLLIIFDPIGGYKYTVEDNGITDSNLVKEWEKKFKFCSCLYSGKSTMMKEAFEEAGYLFASMFEDSDLIPSDVAAGMILLFLRNEEIKRSSLKQVTVPKTLSSIEDKALSVVTSEPKTMMWPTMEKWNSLPVLYHFLKYAMATYTWRILVFGHSKPVKYLWKDAFCCGCIPCRQQPLNVEGDCQCCFLNTSALKGVTQLDNSDIIYATYKNQIFETPFFVAVDHPTKSIVVAVRGTVSLNDVLVDINGKPHPIDVPGLPESFKAHHGMLRCARNVKERLDSLKLLPKLFTSHPDYNLVITGTSLGAGTATILSLIMKADYPALKCYAYSPPGGLLSLDAAKYCESFVISLVYGDDFVPRIGIFSLESWKYQIIAAIKECRTPKYRVLLGGCYWLGGGFPNISYDDDSSFRKDSRSQLISADKDSGTTVVDVDNDNDPETNTLNSSQSSQFGEMPSIKKLQPFEKLYPPGNLLYITETESFHLGRNNPNYTGDPRWTIRWAKRSEFREMLITPRMIADHVPFRMYKSLRDLSERGCNSIDLNPSNFPVIGDVLKGKRNSP